MDKVLEFVHKCDECIFKNYFDEVKPRLHVIYSALLKERCPSAIQGSNVIKFPEIKKD